MASEPLNQLKQRWAGLARRERQGVVAASILVTLALVWFVGVAPALRTLARGPVERSQLDAQQQTLQSLQQRARQMQAQPAVGAQDALRALQSSVAGLGASARVQVLGDQVTVVLQQAPADALAQWLSKANGSTFPAPRQVQLQRAPGSASWNGNVVFRLPADAP